MIVAATMHLSDQLLMSLRKEGRIELPFRSMASDRTKTATIYRPYEHMKLDVLT